VVLNVTDSYAYAPYGEATVQGTTWNPFRYSGRHGVMDDGNGLNYMRARYYKPEIARFMSLDAVLGGMEKPQSLNQYTYVQGDPVGAVDPSGKYGVDIHCSAPVLRIGTLTLMGTSHLRFSLNIGATGSHVPHKSLNQVHATLMPDAVWTVNRFPPDLSQVNDSPWFRRHPYTFDTSLSGSLSFVSLILT